MKTGEKCGIASVIGIGAALRFFNLDHGLPEMVAVDAFKFIDEASRIVASGDWTPQIFQYPRLFTHLLVILYSILNPQTIYAQHLIASGVIALSGTLLVGATYLLARRICAYKAALLAAFLTAMSPAFVTYSRIPAPDVLMTLSMTLCLWLLLDETPTKRTCIGAGLLAGLAIGTKFTALYLIPFLVIVQFIPVKRTTISERLLHSLMSVISAIIAFSLTTPQFWLYSNRFIERLLRETAIQKYGQLGRVQLGWFDYLVSQTPTWEQPWLGTSIASNLGWPFLAVTLIAFGLAIHLARRCRREFTILAVFAIVFLLLISGAGHLKAYRFLLPILPVFFTLAAWGVAELQSRFRQPFSSWAAIAVTVVVLATPVVHTLILLRLTLLPTTNDVSALWIEENIPAGTTVLLSPFFIANLARRQITAVGISNVGSRQYGRPPEVGPSPERTPVYYPEMLRALRASGVRLVITNSYFDDAFSPVQENLIHFPVSVHKYRLWRNRLESEGRLLVAIDGVTSRRMGPDIEIWQLP